MFDKLKVRSARFIASRRQWSSMRALHAMAAFFENAYENEEWDLAANGELALVRRLTPAGFATVIDVGAHLGDWSMAALAAWRGATVHAFEVAPPTFERFKQRIDAAGLAARVVLNAMGLSDTAGTREMYYFPDHPNLTCDRPRHSQFRTSMFTGTLTTGDAYVKQQQLGDIDFVKIDVEGAEPLVLKGFRETIEAGRLHCIQFEYGAFSIQTHVLLADDYELLSEYYWIGKVYPTYIDFRDYDWRMESFRFCNFLCVSRRRSDLRDLVKAALRLRSRCRRVVRWPALRRGPHVDLLDGPVGNRAIEQTL
jgi:FkbM family methyltransferase